MKKAYTIRRKKKFTKLGLEAPKRKAQPESLTPTPKLFTGKDATTSPVLDAKAMRISLEWSVYFSCFIGLIAGSGNLAQFSILGLVVVGAIAASLAMLEYGLYTNGRFRAWLSTLVVWALLLGTGVYVRIHSSPSTSDSLVQFDHLKIVMPNLTLVAGQRIRADYYYINAGGGPALDSQSWGLIYPMDPKFNQGLRKSLDQGTIDGYKKFSGQGAQLNPGQQLMGTAWSNPLFQGEIDDLMKGDSKLYFAIAGAWTDERNGRQYWSGCRWINWYDVSPSGGTVVHLC